MSDLTQFRDHCRRMAAGKPFRYRTNAGEDPLVPCPTHRGA